MTTTLSHQQALEIATVAVEESMGRIAEDLPQRVARLARATVRHYQMGTRPRSQSREAMHINYALDIVNDEAADLLAR